MRVRHLASAHLRCLNSDNGRQLHDSLDASIAASRPTIKKLTGGLLDVLIDNASAGYLMPPHGVDPDWLCEGNFYTIAPNVVLPSGSIYHVAKEDIDMVLMSGDAIADRAEASD
ncbi:amidase signature domain-containing protein [Apiospora marii]|uniref:Amidase signature domain-containing protein n=1 Tax=Apiospora marii TaxID=335849 RepID=A0ABR1R2B5_9PEZI